MIISVYAKEAFEKIILLSMIFKALSVNLE